MNEGEEKADSSVILVVDDDRDLRQTIQWVLEEEGFAVLTAADGREALDQVVAQQPALVLLDMGLPLLNGADVARQIYTRYGKAVPIVLITADGHAEEKSQQIGAASFLRKPFQIEHLIQAVEQALHLS